MPQVLALFCRQPIGPSATIQVGLLDQFRIVCSEGSNSRARTFGLRPARTNSNICCRNSGGYCVRIVDSFLPKGSVSTKRGQLQLRAFIWSG